jgi:hypothetical protein
VPILSQGHAVEWQRHAEGHWCQLEKLDPPPPAEPGVYIIWHGGARPRVLRVGHGVLADRLAELGEDPRLCSYRRYGTLFVTWAEISQDLARGAAKYIANRFRPVHTDALTGVTTVPVTAPF